jgi:hypothetical protein
MHTHTHTHQKSGRKSESRRIADAAAADCWTRLLNNEAINQIKNCFVRCRELQFCVKLLMRPLLMRPLLMVGEIT